jgi:class 3 adenylate cyclase
MSDDEHTFLFMDLVGFTALTAERGDDRAADVAQQLYGHVRALLSDHRAEEIKTFGDAMMLRCEDPQLAIELGVRIVDGLSDSDALPPVRVGVHRGTAVSRDGDWYGSAVNVASRLCSAAGGAEVLVSEEASLAAGTLDGVEFGERRLHWLKNVPEPIAARSAAAVQQRTSLAAMLRGKTKMRRSAPCPAPAAEVPV